MSEIAGIAASVFKRLAGRERIIVAIAGAPGSGKSTLAGKLQHVLPEGTAAVVPMDGFHYDDAVLNARGLRQRKGAPETFDFAGFKVLLTRLREREPDVAIPVFDRSMELSRAGGAIVTLETRIVLVEGNYLLLDEAPWSGLEPMFDYSIFVDVSREDLERRLMQRWHDHGKTPQEARDWIASNDMPNIERVLSRRRVADLVVR